MKVVNNNAAYVLLGLIIEKITKKSYRDYVQEEIFKKANMRHSGFFAMDDVWENVAEVYKKIIQQGEIKYKKNIYSYPPIGTSEGGAYVTAQDLANFMIALIKHQLLDETMTKQIFLPKEKYKSYGEFEKYIGYGFEFIINKIYGNEICMYKDGINAGTSGMLKYYKDKNMILIVLSNNEYDVWGLTSKLEEKILKSSLI